jgi:hypothetical protein
MARINLRLTRGMSSYNVPTPLVLLLASFALQKQTFSISER